MLKRCLRGLALGALLFAAACGASDPQVAGPTAAAGPVIHASDRPTTAGVLRQAPLLNTPAGLGTLGGPAELAALPRSSSFTLQDGRLDAASYDNALPHALTTGEAWRLLYSPAYGPGSFGLTGMAYATYRFTLPDYTNTAVSVNLSWQNPPVAGAEYVCLANFDTGRWEWYQDPAAQTLSFTDFGPYIDGADQCLLAVLISGTQAARLDHIQIATPQPPQAVLGSDVDSGSSPLTVFFDGSGSTDPDGAIVDYEWDFDGNGIFNEAGDEATAHGQGSFSHTFDSPGDISVSLRVTDADNFTSTASKTIAVGTSTNSAPVALLSADIDTGDPPLAVNFDASASSDVEGPLAHIYWDFDGDGVFGEADNGELAAQDDATPPTVTYVDPGEYGATVKVEDGGGLTDSALHTIKVNAAGPVTAILQADFYEGNQALNVNFDGSNSLGAITNYEWDFDDNGVFNEAGAEAAAEGSATPATYSFNSPYVYPVTLRVSDALSNTDTDTKNITVHGWVNVELPESGVYPSVGVVNGHPAVCYHNQDSTLNLFTCRYSYSTLLYGAHLSDWSTPVSVETAVPASGWQSNLLDCSGAPGIAYYSTGTGNVYFERAASATGELQADWSGSSTLVDSAGGETYYGFKGAIVNGNPAIAWYRKPGATGELRYARSSTATGAAPTDWSTGVLLTVDSSGGETGKQLDMTTISGTPAISYADGSVLKYAHATSSDGSGVWNLVTVNAGESPYRTGLFEVAGGPAIMYFSQASNSILYRRSLSLTGNQQSDWQGGTLLTLPVSGPFDSGSGVGIVNGHPAITLRRSSSPAEIRYLEATTVDGAAIDDWNNGINETADSAEPFTGEWMEMAVLPGGQPCVIGRGRYVSPTEFGVRYSVKF